MFFTNHRRPTLLLVSSALFSIVVLFSFGYRSSGGPALPASMEAVVPTTSIDWGLFFPTKGQPPVIDVSAAELAKYDAYYLGDTSKKVIYLTFDSGYDNGYTSSILDTLKKHKVQATFFITGNMIQSAPDLVRRMAEEGHIVGNHTLHHLDMSKVSDEVFHKEFDDLAKLYKETTGQEMSKYYRPPEGKFSVDNLKQAQTLGYKTVFWSLAYVDWYIDKQPTHAQAFDILLSYIHDGAIVLLHPISKTNAEILDELLTKWSKMGYTFASLDDLTIS